MQPVLTLVSTFLLFQVPGAGSLSPADRAELVSLQRPQLGELRAGGTGAGVELDPEERAALRCSSAEAYALGEMRAGDLTLSDRDLQVILITAAVIVILILIF